MFRSLLLFLIALLLVVPVFSQTEQDTVITNPPPVPPPDTIVKKITPPTQEVKPIITQQAPPPVTDTTIAVDTTVAVLPEAPVEDSFSRRPLFAGKPWDRIDSVPLTVQVLQHHPFYDFTSKPAVVHAVIRQVEGKEVMFYALAGFLFVFALIREGFGKYFGDMFRVFFQSSMKQRQLREQLIQSPLPSLIFNIFFVASAGLYLDFVLQHFKIAPVDNFWLLYLYCCIGLAVIYLVKFIGLKITGWLFKMNKAADSYIFIVFSINKVLGIFLLPFPIFLAFTGDPAYTIAMVISWCGVGALLLYRFILGFAAIRNEVRFNLFHFFLYLCAFELAPLLLIYKLLLLVF